MAEATIDHDSEVMGVLRVCVSRSIVCNISSDEPAIVDLIRQVLMWQVYDCAWVH